LREFGLEEYGYLSRHSNEVTSFPWLDGHDPFDRLLLSQASGDNLILITSDAKVLDLALPWILDAEK
jgi:PIN domain nuclease of toxin-antitoxin system